MKAVICQNEKLSLAELPEPQLTKGQVLLKVLRCGICGSDLHLRHHCDHMSALARRDKERGVVLAEERSRAGPMLEASIAMLKLQLGDHPYGRPPIGLRKVIETVTPATIRGFYDAYYRPERAILLVVGDVNVQTLIPQISEQFGDWKGRGEAGGDPKPVMVKPPSPDVAMLVTAGAPDTAVTLRWFEPYQERAPTKAEVRKNLVEQLGAGIVARRMQGINEAAGKPAAFIGSASPSAITHVWNGEMASSGRVTDVAKTIDVMVKAHRQAIEFGVTQEELDRQISLRLDASKREAERGRTGTSVSLVESALDYIDADVPFVSLQQSYALLVEQVPTITLAEVNAALKARFTDKPMLTYRGSEPPKGGEQADSSPLVGNVAPALSGTTLTGEDGKKVQDAIDAFVSADRTATRYYVTSVVVS